MPAAPLPLGRRKIWERLHVWWLQLGITHQRSTPGSPQENGAHERLHKTLKARATRPPAARWPPSLRAFPERIAPPEYPGHVEVWRISSPGTFRLHAGQYFLSQALNGEHVAFEEVADGVGNIVYYTTLLGRFDERTHHITGAPSLKDEC